MKKILSGILGLFLVVGVVAGTGYALFSSKTTMSGMVLGTATPDLEIGSNKFTGSLVWADSFNLTQILGAGNSMFQPLIPGQLDWGEFWLRNNSSTDDLKLGITGLISSATGDWNTLKDDIYMRVCIYDTTQGLGEGHCDLSKTTGWKTLAQWNAGEVNLPGSPLEKSVDGTHYSIGIKLDSNAGNTFANKSVSLDVEITGTQAL